MSREASWGAGSTVPRRGLGRELRRLREAAGLSVDDVAAIIHVTRQTVWRFEKGLSPVKPLIIDTLCREFDVDDETRQTLVALQAESSKSGWWQAYGDVIPKSFQLYLGLEGAASSIDCYVSELVPGLLQTQAYMRFVVQQDLNNETDSPEEIERRVTLRQHRQSILTRETPEPPTLDVILNEAILRRPIGDTDLWVEQLNHLLAVADLPAVRLRVIPFAAGFNHGVLTGSYSILRFPQISDGRETEPPAVYRELYTGALYLEKEGEIKRYDETFKRIGEQAQSEADSRKTIESVVKEIRRQ